MKKVYEYLTIFFLGIIAGFIVFFKFLQKPGESIHIEIGKIKYKNNNDSPGDLEIKVTDNEGKQRKIRLFKKKKS